MCRKTFLQTKIENMQGKLFSIDQTLSPRQIADSVECIEVFKSISGEIYKKIVEAQKDYDYFVVENPLPYSDPIFNASFLHRTILSKMLSIDGMTLYRNRSEAFLLKYCNYTIWVKKLDKGYSPKINKTNKSFCRYNQIADGDDDRPLLLLGYQLDGNGNLSQVYFVYRVGEELKWVVDICEMIANANQFAILTPQDSPALSVKKPLSDVGLGVDDKPNFRIKEGAKKKRKQ